MFDPEDFRRLAARLVQRQCDAAEARTAISRAYYAAFLVVKGLLDPSFRFEKTAECHAQIQMVLVNCDSEDARRISRKLDDLRSIRNRADYDTVDASVNQLANARLEVTKSTRLIQEAKALLSASDAQQWIEQMKSWAVASGKLRLRS